MSTPESPQSTDHRPQVVVRLCCGPWTVVCGLLLVLLGLTTGCALFTSPRARSVAADTGQANMPDDGCHDYVGVIHIHTQYSDGAGTFEDIARIANQQALDYLLVTDHNTLKPLRDGKQGWHGATLVLVGTEISTKGGHYLAFNVTQEVDRHRLTTQQVIDEVNRQGGLGFIAHPYFKKRRWTDWNVSGFTGVEAYNVAHDTLDENRLRLVLWTLTVPTEPFYLSLLDRPYDPLQKWDELIARHGRVVGIGSSDAHEVRVLGMKFAPYDVMFQLIRTHLLIPSAELSEQAVYDALRVGHAYLSIELVAPATGFTWLAQEDHRVAGIMGDEVALTPQLQLRAWLPRRAHLTLFKDGRPIDTAVAQQWDIPVSTTGAYRLEATYQGKPWIFSNPIYVKPLPQQQATSDPGLPITIAGTGQRPAEDVLGNAR